ncbi:MAG: hypothetical protein JNL82_39775 [Myxococcales bacterium]|nr:hypothetical protein [Myxococcales bacterium]
MRLEVTVQGPEGEVMRASLPPTPAQPRALVTLLEGLARWQGAALHTAVVADERADWCGLLGLGLHTGTDEDLPSPLVDAHEVDLGRARRRGVRGER